MPGAVVFCRRIQDTVYVSAGGSALSAAFGSRFQVFEVCFEVYGTGDRFATHCRSLNNSEYEMHHRVYPSSRWREAICTASAVWNRNEQIMGQPKIHSTTIVAVKRDGQVALAGDGQVTLEHTVLKHSAKKVRRLYQNRVIAGFAGSVADAQALSDKFESKLEASSGNLTRAAIEFAKEWRTDRMMRRLEAMMIVTDGDHVYILSGDGNVVEPDDGVAAIGSGGSYASSAAKALVKNTTLSAEQIVKEAMAIAAEICIYTNDQITVDVLP